MPHRSHLGFVTLCLLAAAGLLRADEPPAAPAAEFKATPEQETFFEQKVRPILVSRCLECHSDKKQEGSLRLDSRAALLKGNESGPAIAVGKPEESRLLEVIGHEDVIKMPPKQKLPEAEIATLTEWVKLGAPFPGTAPAGVALGQAATPEGIVKARATHWAFQPIRRPELPPVKDTAWGGSSIDRFILAGLEGAGLAPSPRADRRTLLRRATFDLIGLPPTAEEVAAFENDQSNDAWSGAIDRLLASPHYGERWGRHWLDVARYADTKGYVFTEERKYPFSYTYRDYVIRSFNNDVPFNQFIVEQLAADQLPVSDDKSSLAAMGFLTLGRRFGNNQNDIIDDRIDVVSRGLLGLTTACARCHDHKYDPIPTDDYYSLHGIFASSVEPADLPLIGEPVRNDAFLEYEREVAKREGAVQSYLAEQTAALGDELRELTTECLIAVAAGPSQGLPETIVLKVGSDELRREIVSRWREYLVETAKQPSAVFGPWHELARLPAEGFAEAAAKLIEGLNTAAEAQPRTSALVKEALAGSPPQSMRDVAMVYGRLLIGAHQQWGAVLKENRTASGSGAESAAPTSLPDAAQEELRQVLYAEKSPVNLERRDSRRMFNRKVRDKQTELKRAIDAYKANSPAAPPRAMVMNDAPQPAKPHVMIRGNPGRPGKEVPRRFLQVLSKGDAPAFQQGSGRLELARAIASPDNPLTARVIVNRIWMHHFGKGLVTTPSDFGARGAEPSHPGLLDFLAGTFIDQGWSIKKLHRQILLSNAWQQVADDRVDGLKIDPENRLVWKMNRQRLEFEPLRDALLAAAGRLDRTLGGRPVDLFSRPYTNRRAVYGFIDRQDLPGTFRVFDFASPDVSTPMRSQTTVPQQALFAMNSPFAIDQARVLAARPEVMQASGTLDRVQALYRLIYARHADPEELAAGIRFFDSAASDSGGGIWQYGFGEYDESAKYVRGFTALPFYKEGVWRGGEQLPDPTIGWVNLTPHGGHPGGDARHAAIRRWTAPATGVVTIAATLSHAAEMGDGVRGRIVSSRSGELGSWKVLHGTAETPVERVEVQGGDTLDFVVDCLTNESHDAFGWSPVITLAVAGKPDAAPRRFAALADFFGPAPKPASLSAVEQYVQALLLANEFVFVD